MYLASSLSSVQREGWNEGPWQTNKLLFYYQNKLSRQDNVLVYSQPPAVCKSRLDLAGAQSPSLEVSAEWLCLGSPHFLLLSRSCLLSVPGLSPWSYLCPTYTSGYFALFIPIRTDIRSNVSLHPLCISFLIRKMEKTTFPFLPGGLWGFSNICNMLGRWRVHSVIVWRNLGLEMPFWLCTGHYFLHMPRHVSAVPCTEAFISLIGYSMSSLSVAVLFLPLLKTKEIQHKKQMLPWHYTSYLTCTNVTVQL